MLFAFYSSLAQPAEKIYDIPAPESRIKLLAPAE
jgi:hypothetical protein